MTSNRKISMRQLQILIILSAMGTGVIVLPRRAAEILPEGVQDGWVIAIGLALMAIVVGALISAAARAAQKAAELEGKGSETSFIESAAVLLTKPVAYGVGIIMWVKLVFAAGFELRIFLEISRDIMLPKTPLPIVGGVMIASCAYAAAKGFETRAQVAEVLFGLMILPFIFLFTIAFLDADFTNLKPTLVTDARTLVSGSIRLGFILTGLECLLLVSPYVPREKNLTRAVVGALFVAGVIIIAITAITIASLGRGVATEDWPVLRMMDTIHLPAAFIERQEALMFGFWIVTAFALGNALLFFGGLLVRDVFKKPTFGFGVIITALAVFGVSCIPFNTEEIYAKVDFMYVTVGAFFLVALPLIILIAAKVISIKSVKSALLLIPLLFTFTGCWDKVEIESRAFVVALGVDKKEENYIVTLSVPVIGGKDMPFYGKGGDDDNDDDKQPAHIKIGEGQTILEALKNLDAKNDKNLYYGQTKLIIVGEKLLEDRQFFNHALQELEKQLAAPRRIHVIAAEDPTEILKAKPPGEILPGLYVANIYRDKDKIGGEAFVLDFERLSKTPATDVVIPKIERKDNELHLSGAVLMKNSEKVCDISPEELQGFLWCIPSGNEGAVITENKVSIKIEKHDVKITFEQTEDFNVICALIDVKVKSTEDVPDRNIFAETILKEITSTTQALQNHHLDGYNWLELLRKDNYPLYQQHCENWNEVFAKIKIVPRVYVY